MPEANAFQELISRVRAGDPQAAEQLFRQFEPHVRRAIRIRLVDQRLRRVIDSSDICQSVFGSFFVRVALGQYDLNDPQQAIRLLVDMGRKKLIAQERKERALRRDFRRAESAEAAETAPAREDTPSRQVALRELVDEVRKRLSDEERQLAEDRALGRGWDQIAADHGGSAEALRKKLTRAVNRAVEELGLDEIQHG
jgi:RNA polymerase sigma-70 factor (ECF subfamily)